MEAGGIWGPGLQEISWPFSYGCCPVDSAVAYDDRSPVVTVVAPDLFMPRRPAPVACACARDFFYPVCCGAHLWKWTKEKTLPAVIYESQEQDI